MQDEHGMMHEISKKQFDEVLAKELQGYVSKAERVLQVGDVFKVRNCTFEVSEIKMDGIFAKGISFSEYLNRKDRR